MVLSIKEFFFSTSNHYIATCALLSICNLAIFLTPMTIMSIERPLLFDIVANQTAMTKQLCGIPESAFLDCFKDFQQCSKWRIDAGRSYFIEKP